MGLIYVVRNKTNDKHYVGQTIAGFNQRRRQHTNYPEPTSAFDRAIQKYGEHNFEWEVIDESDDQDILNMLERLHISRYEASVDDWGYNIREGGSNGKHSEESRKRISEARMGMKFTEEHRKNISKCRQGKNLSLEHRKKLSRKSRRNPFPGARFKKDRNPEMKCWESFINFKNRTQYFGTFEDPLSASLVYQLVWNEIYEE